MKCWEISGAQGRNRNLTHCFFAELRSATQPGAAVPSWFLPISSTEPLTKVAGKRSANFLRRPYCQRGDVYPSILTESRPAGLVMAVTDF
jgi:hypothetical protein